MSKEMVFGLPVSNPPTFFLIEGMVIDGTCRIDRVFNRATGKIVWQRTREVDSLEYPLGMSR